MKAYYGSLNKLDAPPVSFIRDLSEMHPDTPTAINKNLELSRLDTDLFPVLVTGVSCWPFLTLAFDCNTKQEMNRVFRATRILRKELKKNGRRNIIGPLTTQSLRPYKSMCQNLQNKELKIKYEPLCKFLGNLKFNGKPSFFTFHKHDHNWKKAFKIINGKQANAYIKARNNSKTDKTVFGVVTQLLSNDSTRYDKTVWYGAFCYAFLRCLFGSFVNNEGESDFYGDYSVKWKTLLLKIMDDRKTSIPPTVRNSKYRELLNSIEDNESKPPLAGVAKRWRQEDRPVLSGLRLGIFHSLYFHPTPSSIKRYLEK